MYNLRAIVVHVKESTSALLELLRHTKSSALFLYQNLLEFLIICSDSVQNNTLDAKDSNFNVVKIKQKWKSKKMIESTNKGKYAAKCENEKVFRLFSYLLFISYKSFLFTGCAWLLFFLICWL